ncbi:DUF1298 domain-containing protein [[Mycobacterium] burgundiense]|uniref:DUF1298 domain-containing protein n=1 Tax=[Mycobacterium] burgundiense TaxID=3064286 RepID=A0ABM9LF77_9MYCO|nr:DUF1298 domain-containing protein [Mycolicibacterium sp. MU0053]CAJ1498045.1 DUF1298 domain-containing protein [Mycolicibacterium sp. MU0053]
MNTDARRLAAVDAQTYWMSAKIPNDQFVLFVFDGVVRVDNALVEDLRVRAAACPDLCLRIIDDQPWRYPSWVTGPVEPSQFVVHRDDAGAHWDACLAAVARLAETQLDPRAAAWRLHLFTPVLGAPAGGPAVTVAVLQLAHALADGVRTAQLAGWLFGRPEPVPPVPSRRRRRVLAAGVAAARAESRLTRDIEAGLVPAPPPSRPALLTNARPDGPRRIRTLVVDRAVLRRRSTVTVAALLAIGTALAGHLRARGEDTAALGAEVPMAKPGLRLSHNHFRNIGVGLYPGEPEAVRAARIAADLRGGPQRAQHPAALAADDALAAVPAGLLRWGVGKFDPRVRSALVTGNTVVSSVDRGPADLRLGAAGVLLTASYPALSPMMGLTHGVHGLGDTVALSVHAADSVLAASELDDYVARLRHALGAPP